MKFHHSCPHFPSYSPFQGSMETALRKGSFVPLSRGQSNFEALGHETPPCHAPHPCCSVPGLADRISPGHRGPPGLHLCRLSWVSYSEMKNGPLRSSLVLPLMGFPFGPKNIAISSPWQRSVLNGSPSLKEHKIPWRFLKTVHWRLQSLGAQALWTKTAEPAQPPPRLSLLRRMAGQEGRTGKL